MIHLEMGENAQTFIDQVSPLNNKVNNMGVMHEFGTFTPTDQYINTNNHKNKMDLTQTVARSSDTNGNINQHHNLMDRSCCINLVKLILFD